MAGAVADIIAAEINRLLAEDGRRVATVEAPARAKKLRERAKECRTLSRIMTSRASAATYLNLAEIYDRLAEQQERLGLNIKTSG